MHFDMALSVRALTLNDIPHIVDYWLTSSPADLARMGADASKFPSAAQFEVSLTHSLNQASHDIQTAYQMWLVDGIAIGFSSLKNVKFAEQGEIHLHMWDASFTGRGYGGVLFCLSAVNFYKAFKLKHITCEPRAANYFPNRLFQKIGFPLMATRIGASSELSIVCTLNRYDITLSIAMKYLRSISLKV